LGEAARRTHPDLLQSPVESIRAREGGFELVLRDGREITSANVVLASGESEAVSAWPRNWATLFQLQCLLYLPSKSRDPRLVGLAGSVGAGREGPPSGTSPGQRGPVLITHWGLSGPGVLRLSAWGRGRWLKAGYQADLSSQLAADLIREAYIKDLAAFKAENGRRLRPVATTWRFRCACGKPGLRCRDGRGTDLGHASRAQIQALAERYFAGRYRFQEG